MHRFQHSNLKKTSHFLSPAWNGMAGSRNHRSGRSLLLYFPPQLYYKPRMSWREISNTTIPNSLQLLPCPAVSKLRHLQPHNAAIYYCEWGHTISPDRKGNCQSNLCSETQMGPARPSLGATDKGSLRNRLFPLQLHPQHRCVRQQTQHGTDPGFKNIRTCFI